MNPTGHIGLLDPHAWVVVEKDGKLVEVCEKCGHDRIIIEWEGL